MQLSHLQSEHLHPPEYMVIMLVVLVTNEEVKKSLISVSRDEAE